MLALPGAEFKPAPPHDGNFLILLRAQHGGRFEQTKASSRCLGADPIIECLGTCQPWHKRKQHEAERT